MNWKSLLIFTIIVLTINIYSVDAQSIEKSGITVGLLENTYICDEKCHSIYNVCLIDSKNKIDDIDFKFRKENQVSLKNYETILKEVPKITINLMDKINNFDCYNVRIDGKKGRFETVDNVICFNDICFDEYAWWHSSYFNCREWTNTTDFGIGERRINLTINNSDIPFNLLEFVVFTNGTNCTTDVGTNISAWNQSTNISNISSLLRYWIEVPNGTFLMFYNASGVENYFNMTETFNGNYFDKDKTTGWSVFDGMAVYTNGSFLQFKDTTSIYGNGYATRFDWNITKDEWEIHTSIITIDTIPNNDGDNFLMGGLDGSTSHRFTFSATPDVGVIGGTTKINKSYYYDGSWLYFGIWKEGVENILVHKVNESDSSTGISYFVFDTEYNLIANATGKSFAVGSPTNLDGLWFGGGSGAGHGYTNTLARWLFLVESQTVSFSMANETMQPPPPPPPPPPLNISDITCFNDNTLHIFTEYRNCTNVDGIPSCTIHNYTRYINCPDGCTNEFDEFGSGCIRPDWQMYGFIIIIIFIIILIALYFKKDR